MINRKDIPQLVGVPDGGIATNCLICKGLEGARESRLSEYVKARSAAYYRVSTELAAYKNVEMERAKSDLEEHRLVCISAAKSIQPEPIILEGRGNVGGKEAKQSRTGESRN